MAGGSLRHFRRMMMKIKHKPYDKSEKANTKRLKRYNLLMPHSNPNVECVDLKELEDCFKKWIRAGHTAVDIIFALEFVCAEVFGQQEGKIGDKWYAAAEVLSRFNMKKKIKKYLREE